MQDRDTIRLETPSLPKGGGAITGLKSDVAKSGPDGAANISIPLPLNAGRGFAPTLFLSYNSRAGNGAFGFGWDINLLAIRRRTKKGVPQFDVSDEFIAPDGEVLVPQQTDDGTPVTRTASALLGQTLESDFTVQSWRSRVETDFSRFEYWVADDSGKDFWVLYTPNGDVHLFGRNDQARISNPENTQQTAVWLTESSVSLTGEQIYWQYRAEDEIDCGTEELNSHPGTIAQRYLSAVWYGNKIAGRNKLPALKIVPDETEWLFMVAFDYSAEIEDLTQKPAWHLPGTEEWACRNDSFSSWEYGFEIRTRRICYSISTYHFINALSGNTSAESTPQLIFLLALTYNTLSAGAELKSIQNVAWEPDNSLTSLPPVDLGWSELPLPPTSEWQQRDDLANLNAWQPYQMIDLNGEGISGILYQDSGAWWYRAPIRKEGGGSDDITWDKPTPLPKIPALSGNGILADLNGDGYVEWLISLPGVHGYYERTPEREWLNFIPISAFPVEMSHPGAQLIDITGAGLSDLVLIGPKSVRLYVGTGENWEKAQDVIQATGITLPIAGRDERVLVAFSDMAGSGQQHLVEVRADSVRYWPNKGHGNFGTPISMTGFMQSATTFNPEQLFLADIDGSGTTDLIYAQSSKISVYLNRSGNTFDAPIEINLPAGVRYDRTCSLQVADIQGLGVASLVLTVPHPVPQHWIYNLTTVKPWLLVSMNNNMGAQRSITYRSSAQFWLDEKQEATAAGEPVPASYLPFALHTLYRSDVIDEITGNHLVSTTSYRGGAWDGREREFRGFGFVEITDSDTEISQGTAVEISPPAVSRNWYATGLTAVDERLATRKWSGDDAAFDSFTPFFSVGSGSEEHDITPDETIAFWLERGLKGLLVRTELFGKDGSDLETIPYQVVENRPTVRLVAEPGSAKYPVIWPSLLEIRTYTYERIANDPQCSQQITLSCDDVGQTLAEMAINYPRRTAPATSPYPDYLPETLFASSYDDQQQQLVVTISQNSWHTLSDSDEGIWLIGLIDTVQTDVYLYPSTSVPTTGLIYESLDASGKPSGTPTNQALASWQRYWYLDSNDNAVAYTPAFPPRLAYSEAAMLDEEMVTELQEDLTDAVLQEAGYLWLAEQHVWVIQGGFTTYDTEEHFWLPLTYRDSTLTGALTISRDPYDCVITKTVDAAGLTTQISYDWRFLTPDNVVDINANVHWSTQDALGRVITMRFNGTENGEAVGYSNTAMSKEELSAQSLIYPTPPLPIAQGYAYVTDSWMDKTNTPVPPHTIMIITDQYDTGAESDKQQVRQSITFSDGFGRELQTSLRYEAGDAWQYDEDEGAIIAETAQTDFRWAISGRTEYDNKGQAIRTFQPFFLNDWRYVRNSSARQDLYADTHYFDPIGREKEVLTAKGWTRRTLYTPWFVVNEDENDTLSS